MGYFVQIKDMQAHSEMIEKGQSIDSLKVWGKDLSEDQYEIVGDGEIKFKNTPYSVTYKACLESGNFFFVPCEVELPKKPAIEQKKEEDVFIDKYEVNDLFENAEIIESEEPKRRGPKRRK